MFIVIHFALYLVVMFEMNNFALLFVKDTPEHQLSVESNVDV